jgi:Mg2+-importing ATPase
MSANLLEPHDDLQASTGSFWLKPADDLLRALGSERDGLSAQEAEKRRRRFGPNLAVTGVRRNILAKLAKRFAEPLVLVLLIAAIVSGATGDWPSAAIVFVIVTASILLDILQEHKAERTMEVLKNSVAVRARVRRDGRGVELPVADLVPGDIVELRGGDLIPADGVVLSGTGALVDESALTGEAFPVEKQPGKTTDDSALFGGCSMVGGEAVMLVAVTGAATRFGAIAAALLSRQPPTAFERGLHALGMLILRLTGFLVLMVVLSQVAYGRLSVETFLFAVALAVGLTPELLPMIMTVTLAQGAVAMAKRKVVVKRLSAIHDLGAMDVLCTDKTGTLTEARISLAGAFDAEGRDDPEIARLMCANSRLVTGIRNNLDEALLKACPDDGRWTYVDDLPFDFRRRRASVLAHRDGRAWLITKGAPEQLLRICSRIQRGDGSEAALDAAERRRLEALLEEKGRQGLRLLGVAVGTMPTACRVLSRENEADLVLRGFAAFVDPPKASAGDAVARLMALGVKVKVISGDAEPVVRHLVGALNLPGDAVMTGDEVAGLNNAALALRARNTDLFVRVAPEQKSRIVQALRRSGHTVGFIGDGINDVPAIHAGDVGISVDGGTEVARQTADIILLEHDLGVLADGVAEGRRTYLNIMKYVRMGTSSNFGNMLSMAVASVLLPFLPLAPIQVLLTNLIYDFSEIGIPKDSVDAELLRRPRSWDMKDVLRFGLIMGPLSSLFDLMVFAWLYWGLAVDVATFRTAWFVESALTQILVIFIIRTPRSAWNSRAHPLLTASSITGVALALVLGLTPLGSIFGFVPLSPALLASIGLITAIYLATAEGMKHFAFRPERKPPPLRIRR